MFSILHGIIEVIIMRYIVICLLVFRSAVCQPGQFYNRTYDIIHAYLNESSDGYSDAPWLTLSNAGNLSFEDEMFWYLHPNFTASMMNIVLIYSHWEGSQAPHRNDLKE